MAVLIVAEVAQAHDGSLGRAHSFIDAVAGCGVDAIKFQTHIAQYESSVLEPWRVKFSYEDKTRYDYWKRMEFTEEQWLGLITHSRERGLKYIGTPFSVEGLQMLRQLGVDYWKIASGEITNSFLLSELAELHEPTILSTGMSRWDEIDRVVHYLTNHDVPLTVMQCTSAYPVQPESVGLNIMQQMSERYHIPVGLSDHTGTIFTSLAAVALGAECIEIHVCMSPYDFGPDTSSSVTIEQLSTLVKGIRYIERIINNPVDKDLQANTLAEIRGNFTKSLYVKQSLPMGTTLEREMLGAKKPCAGISVDRMNNVLGKKTLHYISEGNFLQWEDLSE